MTTEHKKVIVDLGDQQELLEERMASGRYASPSEVIQEAMQALDREDALIEEKILEAMETEGEPLEGVTSKPGDPTTGR